MVRVEHIVPKYPEFRDGKARRDYDVVRRDVPQGRDCAESRRAVRNRVSGVGEHLVLPGRLRVEVARQDRMVELARILKESQELKTAQLL